jgi:predicted nucleic acid-binding protein
VIVWASFLRLATNRRIFEVPTPPPAFIDATGRSRCTSRSLPVRASLHFCADCDQADAVGDLIPDALIESIAVEYSCDLVTLDRGFARFRSVRELRPPGA